MASRSSQVLRQLYALSRTIPFRHDICRTVAYAAPALTANRSEVIAFGLFKSGTQEVARADTTAPTHRDGHGAESTRRTCRHGRSSENQGQGYNCNECF